jgi:alanine dehydrogenase
LRVITAEEIGRALSYTALVDALRDAFRGKIAAPPRHHHGIPRSDQDATLLLMPAWTVGQGQSDEQFLGCKIVTVFPGNAARGLPSLFGSYLLMSGVTGEVLAVIEGRVLTAWRTAAASALAASFLARQDANHLVMVGAGALAPHLIKAHAAVRPIKRVSLWNRTYTRAMELASRLVGEGLEVVVADDLAVAVGSADIVSCATLAHDPIVCGTWLKPGVHVDLVGGFTPHMREADDDVLRRAHIYVDTRAGACKEAGDIVDPLRRGVINESDITGDLFDLCQGKLAGRVSGAEITLFKSVGTALEDLAAAALLWRLA